MSSDLLSLVSGRRGHFLYESGHHGDMWFDLETLCLKPEGLQPYIAQLADRLARYRPEVICGPLVEGAYVGLLVAQKLESEFVYANRYATASSSGSDRLFPIQYQVPGALHSAVRAKRVAIVNDMMNAGSAVRGTYLHLKELGAEVQVVASLMVCGEGFEPFARQERLKVESLVQFDSNLWTPEECPLCSRGEALEALAYA